MRDIKDLCARIEDELSKIASNGLNTGNLDMAYKLIVMYKIERVEINVCTYYRIHRSSGSLRSCCYRYRSDAERQERRPFRCHFRRRRDLPFQGQGQNAGCKACKDDQVVRTCLRYPHSDPEPYLSGQSANEKQRRNFPPLFFVQS